tara:strand:+ start:408 stop:1709 length:1302 start_codon:yes stop_codon:yes gene_type:complete
MKIPLVLNNKSFAIYGLGNTGRSVINFFNKIKFKNYLIWDDNKSIRNLWNLNKYKKKTFFKSINSVDYIIISPGINIKKKGIKRALFKNKHKIITDLDLFFLIYPKIKSIVVTGTNGKSTTCKIIEHVLKKNNFNVKLGGNIGKPILSLKLNENSFLVIEASSFQLAYSKYINPKYALLINITKDHLDWHESMKNYIQSKIKIFSLQKKNSYALLNSRKLFKIFKKNRFKAKLKFINIKNYKRIKNKILNRYLNLQANDENVSFVYELSKLLKIKKKSFIKSLKSFKGLDHRHEIFYKKENKTFINDSKATSFEATRFALKNYKNIFWIVGGLPKVGDKFKTDSVTKNVSKAYIIGKNMKAYENFLRGKVHMKFCRTLNYAVISIFKDTKNIKREKIVILLSPAAASYDQFKNFEERGHEFKKLIKRYVNKRF